MDGPWVTQAIYGPQATLVCVEAAKMLLEIGAADHKAVADHVVGFVPLSDPHPITERVPQTFPAWAFPRQAMRPL